MKTLKVLIAALFLLVGFTPTAWADEPPNVVAGQWSPAQHVVVTPGANPTLINPAALNSQINQTALPIYMAITNATPADLGKAFSQKLGHKFAGVIVAAGSHGVYAAAQNTPGGNQAADIASQVARQYGRNLDAGLHAYVVNFTAAAASATHPGVSVGGSRHSTDLIWLWWTLGTIVVIALLIIGYVAASRRNSARAAQRKAVNAEMIRAKAKVDDLADWVGTESVDVSAEHRKATIAFGDAQTACDKHRYSDAATHLENVNALYSRANKKVNPPPPHSAVEGVRQARAVPHEDRRQATINATTPGGQNVVINNNDYRRSPAPGYTNSWPGGMYRGAYFAPGLYPYAFWGPGYNWSLTDMVIADAIIEDRWEGRYDYQSSSGGGDYTPADTNWGGDTSSQGGGDYDTGQDNSGGDTSSSGGDDYSTPDPDSGYDTSNGYSAPDPTPSYSDSGGGGYDGGSSYDSGGGGGYDSGSSSGGGDGW